MFGWLRPKDSLDEADVNRGLRMLMSSGICAQTMAVLTGGAFLVAFALLLGASNKIIGMLAAIGPLSQLLQLPSIFIVDRTGLRKVLFVISAFFSRVSLVVVAIVPWLVPLEHRLGVFIAALLFHFGLGAVSGCAFNSWIRDLIPEDIMGRYLAKRMAASVAVGAVLSLIAGVGVDFYRRYVTPEIGVYSILFLIGAGFGLLGLVFFGRTPEPKMAPAAKAGVLAVLSRPFKDRKFRPLLIFLAAWNFAVTLASPFFVVYMLKRLELSMTWVMGLVVLSQMVNVLFLKLWGKLADRFTNKSVLAASGPMFMVSTLLWVFTTMPEKHFLTIPLLIIIHALAGMSTAGVTLCAGNMALKTAPRGAATSYLATNAIISGLAATAAPIIAGFGADWFADHELSLNLRWASISAAKELQLPAFNLRGLDFLFIISFILGLYALHRLLAVKEEGEVKEEIVRTHLFAEVRRSVQQVSSVAGIRYLTYFPYGLLKIVSAPFRKAAPPTDDTEELGQEPEES